MKKILLATSAVALFAGAAAAEVTTTGTARMGLVYSDDGVNPSVTQFSSRIRIIFTASGESDSGFSFGASVRNDQSGVGNTSNGDSTVFISGAFGKLTMGDVSGAADSLVGQTSGVGYGPNDGLQEINFVGATKTAVYYEYSTGALTFGLGSGQLDTLNDTYSVGAKYAAGNYSVALAWESSDTFGDMISLGGSATFGAATVKARVSDRDTSGFDTSYSLSLDYVVGATTLTAFYTDFGNNPALIAGVPGDNDSTPPGSTDTQHIGIGASYDLGGGAAVAGGIVMQNNTGVADGTFADLGLKFSF
jgi:outer membrane protein OmpU